MMLPRQSTTVPEYVEYQSLNVWWRHYASGQKVFTWSTFVYWSRFRGRPRSWAIARQVGAAIFCLQVRNGPQILALQPAKVDRYRFLNAHVKNIVGQARLCFRWPPPYGHGLGHFVVARFVVVQPALFGQFYQPGAPLGGRPPGWPAADPPGCSGGFPPGTGSVGRMLPVSLLAPCQSLASM